MFNKILIANRGEIACRIIRTLRRLGIHSVAVYAEADAQSLHVALADEAVLIGPAPVAESYLRIERILEAAYQTGAQAVHPGYGLLSENADFAQACNDAGIVFIGPTPEQMRAFGLKHTARALAEVNQVPLLPGSGLLADLAEAQNEAARIGYPVMLKSTAGGGGIGMRLCWTADELADAFESVRRLSQNNFKHSGLYLEKYVEHARHIEVQIFGDGQGNVIALGERDCSVQRRNQKVIEETPAPNLAEAVRQQLWETAVRLGKAIHYRSAGTVEFVFDAQSEQFYFLEVNTRLQVEHGVTEQVFGVDLVEWMVRQAAGDLAPLETLARQPAGCSMQVRLYAEDPNKNFQPGSGILTAAEFPPRTRVDTWVERGMEVSPFYDPLIAKLIVTGQDRQETVTRMAAALAETRIAGIESNLEYLRQILAAPVFQAGRQTTRFLETFTYKPHTIDVLEPGTQSSIQDYPGRIGYWDIGVPPSGPMDALAFRLGNRILGNPDTAAGLELTISGPTLRFNSDTVIALTGAPMTAQLDHAPVPFWTPVNVHAGAVLHLGAIRGAGCRTYLAIAGGFDVPEYLGSKSTFALGQFGGHAGRTLRSGDVLHLAPASGPVPGVALPPALQPTYADRVEIGVMYGPHGAPDFFTEADIDTFFATDWDVHYNSSRTGVRLIGPKPEWARKDGGEAGLHPSNIHDNAYAIGAIDFTGDMPVILGPDGPSLGGFVCPATIVAAERWKLGQLRPGNKVRFRRISHAAALMLETAQEALIRDRRAALPALPASDTSESPILHQCPANGRQIAVTYRQAGDKYLLVEYGPLVLDLNLRFRVHALMEAVKRYALPGLIDLTPGIRSLQIHFDGRQLPRQQLMAILLQAETELADIQHITVPTRIVHLPLSWDDPATQLAIQKYIQSVRKEAPWCPSNIEFIRRINGLDSIDAVRDIVFNASYLVLGLGDVYLGAPVATPLDPRHRLVTTKYNPARTWTPENAVGIGGAYMCIYGMEGPGGYQFVGRTLQMWNRYRQTGDFVDGKPWLLRFFDQIRFYPVSAQELLRLRQEFIQGRFKLDIREAAFSLSDYNAFLETHRDSIVTFKQQQQAAFEAERERWAAAGHATDGIDMTHEDTASVEVELPANGRFVTAAVAGSIWHIPAKAGDELAAGAPLVVVESMKMEINVAAPVACRVLQVLCSEGSQVTAGQNLMVVESLESL